MNRIPDNLRTDIVERIFPIRAEFDAFMEKYFAARKPRGNKGGGNYVPTPEDVAVYKKFVAKELEIKEAATAMGLKPSTTGSVYKRFMVIAQGVADGTITL